MSLDRIKGVACLLPTKSVALTECISIVVLRWCRDMCDASSPIVDCDGETRPEPCYLATEPAGAFWRKNSWLDICVLLNCFE